MLSCYYCDSRLSFSSLSHYGVFCARRSVEIWDEKVKRVWMAYPDDYFEAPVCNRCDGANYCKNTRFRFSHKEFIRRRAVGRCEMTGLVKDVPAPYKVLHPKSPHYLIVHPAVYALCWGRTEAESRLSVPRILRALPLLEKKLPIWKRGKMPPSAVVEARVQSIHRRTDSRNEVRRLTGASLQKCPDVDPRLIADLLSTKYCPTCLYDFCPTFRPTIERIDNEKGYVEGNVMPLCIDCNQSKSHRTYAEWAAILRRLGEVWGVI